MLHGMVPAPHLTRKARLVASLLLVALPLSGCFDFYQEIYLHSDGSGRAVLRYRTHRGLLESAAASLPAGQRALFHDAPQVRAHFTRPGLRVDDVDIWDEGRARVVRITIAFEELSALDDEGIRYRWTFRNGHRALVIHIRKPKRRSQRGRLQQQVAAALGDHGFHFKVHLPRRVVAANADKLSWSIAEWFVPLAFFLDPDAKELILYAEVETRGWERVRAWWHTLTDAK